MRSKVDSQYFLQNGEEGSGNAVNNEVENTSEHGSLLDKENFQRAMTIPTSNDQSKNAKRNGKATSGHKKSRNPEGRKKQGFFQSLKNRGNGDLDIYKSDTIVNIFQF